MSNLDLIFGDTAIDPICKMIVDKQNPPGGEFGLDGQIYFFCAPGCREEFAKNPTKYL
ncbi:MAG: YHS domain-containing protein [Chloroflexi bacterium]|nr:YHS domain-containing protein [Chloroflexota bacterium]MQF86069.1 YHS domain-containing protein [SAR202 cluster bacterium]|tara:strand:+ start:4107 stop:4280 length:174 start_codon:yes stop_codon:yes gene_type:complete